MPTAYPRLNRGQIRAKVRDLTNIEATLVVSDDRINNLINEEIHKLILVADDIEQFWYNSTGTAPITITEAGVTYRVPGWRFDNTTQFPSGLYGEIYLASDASFAPWNTTSNAQYKAGYYDNYLVYSVAARVLSENADDTNRVAEYKAQADIIGNTILEQEFIGHNADLLRNLAPSSASYDVFLFFKTLVLLKNPLRIDGNFVDAQVDVQAAVLNERNELHGAYAWSFANTGYNDWAPYSDIFAYGAAARLSPRYGLDQAETAALVAEYETRKQALIREKLTNNTGNLTTATAGSMAYQVRSLLRDFSNELPTNVIYNWLNIEYQMLATQHDWPWLTSQVYLTIPSGVSTVNLGGLGVDYSILNAYVVKLDGSGQTTDAQIIAPVPHILDGEVNDARYRYDITATTFTLTPTPTEEITVAIRYKSIPSTLTASGDQPAFATMFAPYLVYRAAYLGSAWSDQAKKLAPMFEAEAQRVKDMMYQYYMTSRSTEPFSIGENALETRKYLPFFKAV
jgi:hypothetical protein